MPDARALVLDIGGVVLRNARELDLDRGIAGSDDERWQAMLRHEITEREYWALRAREVGAVLGHDNWSTRQLITWLYHDADVEFVVDEMVELMDDARAAGLPVVALTNDMTDFHGQEWVDAQEWLEHFDAVVDASMTGALKPAPEAYAHGVAAAGVPAEEIVYLDDLPVNVAGARAVGLQTIEVHYDDRPAAIAEARRRLGLTTTTHR
jgi:putative hydrolase of the HAD superfamily